MNVDSAAGSSAAGSCKNTKFSLSVKIFCDDFIVTYARRDRSHSVVVYYLVKFVYRDAKQFTGLTHCQARNSNALSFAFNASLTSVNIARAFAHQQGMDLSVGSTKTLLHNAAMVERFISMSGKHADMGFNNTDFKELLFYGVRAAV